MNIGDPSSICTQVTNTSEFDPSWIGLNHDFDYYIIFEIPHPWNRKIELGDTFPTSWAEKLTELKNNGIKIKFLAITPENMISETCKVFIYKKSKAEYVELLPYVYNIPKEQVADLLSQLIEGQLGRYQPYLEKKLYRDIFVCIHNNRDQCCGKYGKQLFGLTKSMTVSNHTIRIWQCSHFGGHRMAPTMMEMPSGRVWGFVEEMDIRNIIFHSGDHQKVLKKYRGSMGSSKLAQIAEKELFFFWGWEWFNMKRKAGTVIDNGIRKIITIEFKAYNTINSAEITLLEDGVLLFPANQCDDGKEVKKYFIESVDFRK